MHDISLNILDIVENSINAKATRVEIAIEENIREDKLCITVADNGVGMDSRLSSSVTDPFTTTRTCRKVGLGLPLLRIEAKQCHGDLSIDSRPGEGTTVKVIFQYGHIDRPPLGDIASTLICIISANPGLDIVYQHRIDNVCYRLDTGEIKKVGGECCLKEKSTFAVLSQDIEKGFSNLARQRKKVFKQVFGYSPRVDLV